ncbi:tRNA pseudouridine synthase B [Candidatus Profftia lariciata]|uniref:tRNA pseudouridine(55) synthase TruB n=1 Tax=Candidatus Profftia lariciata TaxID=1987921 RepID=UPI001D035CF0|nr:tRNA pseudouridine(55) synthase TruB [Candidatus Profftia lariciata]UDG81533.1 tRNA pseudouridine synthase B [Candidatus Profftia lariciata]
MSRCIQHKRSINGILLLDKHQNISSNKILQKIKYIYNANKAGHTGTLDPLAVGMLPICFGEATKFSQFLLEAKKIYHVIAKLGQSTSTSDADGEIIEERPVSFSKIQLNYALTQLLGNSTQIPSMYSAIKYHGKPLYQYARQGIEIPRKTRNITIYKLQLINYKDNKLELEITCSKGTYIRTIIDNLGSSLGCGAHVTYLRRVQVANYSQDKMITVEQLQKIITNAKKVNIQPNVILDSLLLPIETVVSHLPVVNLTYVTAKQILHGQKVQLLDCSIKGMVRINIEKKCKFIGIGEVNNLGYLVPHRLLQLVDQNTNKE